jgi:predicted RND superfamily exporter protein
MVLRHPRTFLAIVIGALVLCVASFPWVRFDGNVLNVLSNEGAAFTSYRHVQRDFRDFSGDLGVIVQSDDLFTPEGFEKLRTLHLDLTLTDGVVGVFSPFSSSRIEADGAIVSDIPEEIAPGTDVKAMLTEIGAGSPLVAQLVRLDANAALMSIETNYGERVGEERNDTAVRELISEVRAMAPPGFEISFVGYPLMRADAVQALKADQIKLTVIGISVVFVLAMITFRALLPAVICALPAVATLIWVVGMHGLTGTPVNYLSAALPTIAMVVALVDTVMLYYGWLAKRREGLDSVQAIRTSILRVGPANSMNMVTSGISFGSFALGGNSSMIVLALLGISAVVIAFLTVLVILPLTLYFVGNRVRIDGAYTTYSWGGPSIARVAIKHRWMLTAVGFAATLFFASGHFMVGEQHAVTAQMPAASEAARGERLASQLFGGIAPIYMVVPVPAGKNWSDPQALDVLEQAERAFAEEVGEDRVLSLARLKRSGMDQARMEEMLAQSPDNLTGRFLSRDRRFYLITSTVPYGMDPPQALEVAEHTVDRLEAQGMQGVEVTGYPILASVEIPKLINSLRQSFVWAIVIAIAFIAVASRAPTVALATLLPNLVPLVFIEWLLWMLDVPMDIAHIIALTIAFGITVDNSIHFINAFLADSQAGMSDVDAMRSSIVEVAPAMVSASLMFIAGSVGTLFSDLPSVVNLGFLIITTLALALFCNLYVLGAMILTFRQAISRRS